MSADHSTIAGGYASGNIFTWEIARPAKPFLHIPPVDRKQNSNMDGHGLEVAVLHVGFLGTRHTALVSADEKGMAFSHLATRGMGAVSRSVRTSRILGRYPENGPSVARQRKPSSVLSFSPLPLGNAEHASDSMGLVAMLTPYLLVIVSTLPIPQTQYKSPRPKEVAAHGAMSAALAWFPSVKLKNSTATPAESSSKVKLVYSWSNILSILEVVEEEPSEPSEKGAVATLDFRSERRWKAEEAIVGLQWLSRSVLAVLTITQQLLILEENSLRVTDSCDLIQKHIYHVDLFSQQLHQLVEHLDEEDDSMHGVVADAFYMSFRAYKGRFFLLGFNEVSFGTLSNWADRLLALMEQANFIGAIRLATAYYDGAADKVTVGLPEDDILRHKLVQEKVLEMMSASLKYAFGKNIEARTRRVDEPQLEELAAVCIRACISMVEFDFLFDEVYTWYQEENVSGIFLEILEHHIMEGELQVVPTTVIKDLIHHYMKKGREELLEEVICNLDPRTIDIDHITALCKQHHLYDALLYVWTEALGDYTSLLPYLLDFATQSNGLESGSQQSSAAPFSYASRLFPYLSYTLTSRVYPTGKQMLEEKALLAKAEIYHFFFSGSGDGRRRNNLPSLPRSSGDISSFPNLRKVLDFDASSFLSTLNEAFEDSFLNGNHTESPAGKLTEAQIFGLSVNRQQILQILLVVMDDSKYGPEDIIYLYMFIARNLPKFPQSIQLPGNIMHHVLVGLCKYPGEDFAEDCQLSVEYLLSIYHPPNLLSLIPLIQKAQFYRVLKSLYKADRQFAKLLQTCIDDYSNPDAIFDCIGDCLRPGSGLTETQIDDVRAVLIDHASDIVSEDIIKAARTVQSYTPDLHEAFLTALGTDDYGQFQYLRAVLEPSSQATNERQLGRSPSIAKFVERYVRLLCRHDPQHVTEFIEHLKAGDLRLEEVLPALENSGVVDGAVVLMAREGRVREAMNRLTTHLRTLQAALLGLLEGAASSPDFENTLEAAHDLVASIQKYSRVGVWLCLGQTQPALPSERKLKESRRSKSRGAELSVEESMWLELIDGVVGVTKTVTEVLEEMTRDQAGQNDAISPELSSSSQGTFRLVTDLRLAVQETFTSLLATTSAPRTKRSRPVQVSFLRILQAFLSRASSSSPSLSNLRGVLTTIFSAYAYEESLLSLANHLLDNDLFVHVAELDSLRRRGWRPLGQVCEGCGRKVWGPGAGGHIWDAWKRKHDQQLEGRQQMCREHNFSPTGPAKHGKGKSAMTDALAGSSSIQELGLRDERNSSDVEAYHENGTRLDSSAVVVFSCRHMFHQACLEAMQGRDESAATAAGAQGGAQGGAAHEARSPALWCPLCL